MHVGKMLERFRSCPDTEPEQAIIRFLLISAIFVYLFLLKTYELESGGTFLIFSWAALSNSVVIIFWVVADPKKDNVRRVYSVISDSIYVSVLMYFGEERAILLFAIYIWVTIGYGFRFGVKYLYLSLALSTAMFSLVILNNDYWGGEALPFSVGVLFSMIIIPLYATTLIGHMRAAIERADKANRAKTWFLASMSHEMRTPLNGMLGFLNLMRRELPGELIEKYLDPIRRSADKLLVLIDDVLDRSQVEAGEFNLTEVPVELKRCLEEAALSLRPAVEQKGLQLVVDLDEGLPEMVECDPTRLHQVISNLVNNSAKFTREGKVQLSACWEAVDRESPVLRLVVEDTGIGIPKDSIDTVFEPFRQLDTGVDRAYEGSGLGLNITKSIVEKMGGEISIESETGKFTKITVELPLKVTDSVEAGPEVETGDARITGAAGVKALVVDDDLTNREFLKALLDLHGFDTDTAGSGAEAIEMVQGGAYRFVFMDVHMAHMDGAEVARRVRQIDPEPAPVIIAVTADVIGHREGLFDISAFDGVLSKPVDERGLLDLLGTFLDGRQAREGESVAGEQCEAAVLDREKGVRLASGNEALWRNGIADLINKLPSQIDAIKRAVAENDHKMLKSKAHRVVGTSAYVGADALANSARRLEAAAVPSQACLWKKRIEDLELEFARLCTLAVSNSEPHPELNTAAAAGRTS